MKMITICFLAWVSLTGCTHVRPDPVAIAAIDANYHTAELSGCGYRSEVGLLVCPILKGESYSSLGLSVRGYYQGNVKIVGSNCDVNYDLTYEGTKSIPIEIAGAANDLCLITVTVAPKFPREQKSGIKIHAVRGYIAIPMVASKDDWLGDKYRITGNSTTHLRWWVGEQDSVRLYTSACGRTHDLVHSIDQGFLNFTLEDLIPTDAEHCVIDGFIESAKYKTLSINILVERYNALFTPLPVPSVKIEGSHIYILADTAVSAITLNESYVLNHKAKLKFDSKKEYVMSLLTVKGRVVTGIWKPEHQEWKWKQ